MRLEDKLYAYAGKTSGKVYTILAPSPALAKVYLMLYLRYEPIKETGGYIHRTLKETEALLPKFVLKRFKVVPDDG